MGTTLKDRALDIASSWFECLNSGDLERVLELYDSKATFHPTLSANFGRDEAATRSYFSEFLRKQPTATLRAYAIQRLSDNAFLISGTMHIQLDEEVRIRKSKRDLLSRGSISVVNGESFTTTTHCVRLR